MKTVRVNLGAHSYDILVGAGPIARAGDVVRYAANPSGIIIIADKNTDKIYGGKLEASFSQAGYHGHTIVVEAGEKSKSFDTFRELAEKILSLKPDRKTAIVALGGGVVGDLSGFVAATLLRGLNFIQIPTTLLAQVDSSVGGKNGINTRYGKNLVGTFYQPKLVIADTEVLSTLPKREVRAGYAEVVKYGLINDYEFFEWLERNALDAINGDQEKLEYIVSKSCESKAYVVERDEKESGLRMLLNLGHTFGHALEAITGFSAKLLHGEAVAIGMVMAFEYSSKLGLCDDFSVQRLKNHLRKTGLYSSVAEAGIKTSVDAMINYMYQDKKLAGGKLNLVLAKGIGNAFVYSEDNPEKLKEYIKKAIRA